MSTIIAYRKYIDALVTRELRLPEDESRQRVGTELATIGEITYVRLPDGAQLPLNQPTEIADSIETVSLTPELRTNIANASPCVQFIRRRVEEMIAEHYSLTDEIKLLRTAPSPEFEVYNAFAEGCRAWGRQEKAKFGL